MLPGGGSGATCGREKAVEDRDKGDVGVWIFRPPFLVFDLLINLVPADPFAIVPKGSVVIGKFHHGHTLAAIGEQLLSRSEEHTSELQSLMRISYAVFCLKKKKNNTTQKISLQQNNIRIP